MFKNKVKKVWEMKKSLNQKYTIPCFIRLPHFSILFYCRLIGQRYHYNYGKSMPCEQLVSWLCDIKQAYTQYGGKRPFGVSLLYMGWDEQWGYQLYQSDPSGN